MPNSKGEITSHDKNAKTLNFIWLVGIVQNTIIPVGFHTQYETENNFQKQYF